MKFRKKLEDMSFAELGQLFPIIVVPYDPAWPALYAAEEAVIKTAAKTPGVSVTGIFHYGSTAVPGLCAKPTIDILLEISSGADTEKLKAVMKAAGYLFDAQPDDEPPHMMFMKGYTPEGFKGQAYHVHVRYHGLHRELHFRDYLCAHPETAVEYGRLKLALKERYEHDREAYTRGKSDFINGVTAKALK